MKRFLNDLMNRNMESKVEKYIADYTKKCSNEVDRNSCERYVHCFTPWLTPDHARAVALIAKEEMIERACEYFRSNHYSEKFIIDFCKTLDNI